MSTEVNLEPRQASMMEFFEKIFNPLIPGVH